MNSNLEVKKGEYCPCQVPQSEDTICPCKYWRVSHRCLCGKFKNYQYKFQKIDLWEALWVMQTDGNKKTKNKKTAS